LWGAIGAVFGSWNNQRAIIYRRLNKIPDSGARPSTSRRWSSATWGRLRHRRSLHPRPCDRRQRVLREYLRNAQGEMSWPASARPSRSPN
jgi:pyruvate,orthophosphate dikinase